VDLWGYAYWKGEGVKPDLVKSYLWYSLAAKQNNSAAVSGLAYISKRMTPAQITEGQRLVDAWHKQEASPDTEIVMFSSGQPSTSIRRLPPRLPTQPPRRQANNPLGKNPWPVEEGSERDLKQKRDAALDAKIKDANTRGLELIKRLNSQKKDL
jgi:TPR repeat protein